MYDHDHGPVMGEITRTWPAAELFFPLAIAELQLRWRLRSLSVDVICLYHSGQGFWADHETATRAFANL
jgi:hypothetical protein